MTRYADHDQKCKCLWLYCNQRLWYWQQNQQSYHNASQWCRFRRFYWIGQNMGAGNTERAKKTFHYSLKMCTLFLLILGFIFSRRPVSQTMVSFFSTDAKVIPLFMDYLSIIAFWCFTNAFYNVSQGLFQGCGHTLITMLVDASRIWLFRLLSLWICANVFHMGVASVWYSVVISNGTSAIILYLLYWTGIWKKGYADPL